MKWYCSECEMWLDLSKNRFERRKEHWHQGLEDGGLDRLEILSWHGFGIRPMAKEGTWRLYWHIVHTGYSENPSWGNEPGGWVHTHHRVVRINGKPAQGTREEMIALASDERAREQFDLDNVDVACGAGFYF